MTDLLRDISTSCFGTSYLLAWGCELARLRWPRPAVRWAAVALGAVGLFLHSVLLAVRLPNPAAAYGGTLAVAWVLAVFYLYGALHAPRRAWGVFVLPMVLGLVAVARFAVTPDPVETGLPEWASGNKLWGAVHGLFVLLAAVGVCVGCVASVMYLLQADRLRRKLNPLGGPGLLSLERLEAMNRRALNVSFPLLTLGLLLGLILMPWHELGGNWLNLKTLGTVGLWGVFGVLLYLRSAKAASGRRLAWLTVGAFGLMLAVLVAAHPLAGERAETDRTSRKRERRVLVSVAHADSWPVAHASGSSGEAS